jgi:transcriptional regulator with XRE-family HTH domain
MIELRVCAGLAIRARRKRLHLTQKELATRLGTTQQRVSNLEQARTGLSLDLFVRVLVALGCSDDELAEALNPSRCFPVGKLRRRAALRYFPRPLDDRREGWNGHAGEAMLGACSSKTRTPMTGLSG